MWIIQHEQDKQQVTPIIQIIMLKYHNVLNKVVVKGELLEFLNVGEQEMLILQITNWK